MNMKRVLKWLLCLHVLLSACSTNNTTEPAEETATPTEIPQNSDMEEKEEGVAVTAPAEDAVAVAERELEKYENFNNPEDYYSLDDSGLRQYIEDKVYMDLVAEYQSEDFIIENVNTSYVSKEYIEELEYNSKENIFFGYTLSELNDQFQGKRYIFTLGEDGKTEVQLFEEYSDDTYSRAVKNVAIGSGVILVCVTVSAVTGGLGAAPVSMVFAASAKTATTMALSASTFSSVFAGTLKAIQTGDPDEALKAAALSGSQSFKWAAIGGALIGGATEASALISTSRASSTLGQDIQQWRLAEKRALEKYGGQEQLSYLDGVEVPRGTPGATRPDVIREIHGHLEAIEVKYYDVSKSANRSELLSELEREISARVASMPEGTTQRVVLDVTGRGFPEEMMDNVVTLVQARLDSIYPNIPVDVIW